MPELIINFSQQEIQIWDLWIYTADTVKHQVLVVVR